MLYLAIASSKSSFFLFHYHTESVSFKLWCHVKNKVIKIDLKCCKMPTLTAGIWVFYWRLNSLKRSIYSSVLSVSSIQTFLRARSSTSCDLWKEILFTVRSVHRLCVCVYLAFLGVFRYTRITSNACQTSSKRSKRVLRFTFPHSSMTLQKKKNPNQHRVFPLPRASDLLRDENSFYELCLESWYTQNGNTSSEILPCSSEPARPFQHLFQVWKSWHRKMLKTV